MKVYFRNSSGRELRIGEADDDKQASKIIKRFCDDRNFKIHYTRKWLGDDGREVIDVGSHTEFFIIER